MPADHGVQLAALHEIAERPDRRREPADDRLQRAPAGRVVHLGVATERTRIERALPIGRRAAAQAIARRRGTVVSAGMRHEIESVESGAAGRHVDAPGGNRRRHVTAGRSGRRPDERASLGVEDVDPVGTRHVDPAVHGHRGRRGGRRRGVARLPQERAGVGERAQDTVPIHDEEAPVVPRDRRPGAATAERDRPPLYRARLLVEPVEPGTPQCQWSR